MRKQDGKEKRKLFKIKNSLTKQSEALRSPTPISFVIPCNLWPSQAFLVSIWPFNPVLDFPLLCFFPAFHATFYFSGPRHPSMITVLLLTGTIILCYFQLALHYTFRSRLSKVITSSKNIYFWCLAFSKFLTDIISSISLESRYSDDRGAPKGNCADLGVYVCLGPQRCQSCLSGMKDGCSQLSIVPKALSFKEKEKVPSPAGERKDLMF